MPLGTGTRRRGRTFARWIGWIGFAVSALVLLELTLRLAGWVTLRGRAAEGGASDPAAFRILNLGESTTFGLGVQPHQAYPAVVADILRQRHPERRLQSVNRGVPGLVTASMLRTLPDKLAELRPDLVTILAGANDYNEQLNGLENPDEFWLPSPLASFVPRLRLYKLARLAFDLTRPGVKIEHGEVIYYRHGASQNILYESPIDDAKIARVTARLEGNLEKMITLARQAGARVVLVGYLQAIEENRVLQRVAERAGVPFVSTFIDRDRRPADLFGADGWHPSPLGHRHIAEAMADSIEPILAPASADRAVPRTSSR
jgi:lysophospholipase L1-like esterase